MYDSKYDPDREWADIVADLRECENHDDEESLGRDRLASLLHRAPHMIDDVLRQAKRDPAMLRCLAASCYYSGLGGTIQGRIEALVRQPFPLRQPPSRRKH